MRDLVAVGDVVPRDGGAEPADDSGSASAAGLGRAVDGQALALEPVLPGDLRSPVRSAQWSGWRWLSTTASMSLEADVALEVGERPGPRSTTTFTPPPCTR